jgi:hypothetical protein
MSSHKKQTKSSREPRERRSISISQLVFAAFAILIILSMILGAIL